MRALCCHELSGALFILSMLLIYCVVYKHNIHINMRELGVVAAVGTCSFIEILDELGILALTEFSLIHGF
jgi:hypothetical protein